MEDSETFGETYDSSRRGISRRRGLIRMTSEEHYRLRMLLSHFKHMTLRETGLVSISGGFADAEMMSYNGKSLLIRLKFGVKSDCENRRTIEKYRLQRTVLNENWDITKLTKLVDNMQEV